MAGAEFIVQFALYAGLPLPRLRKPPCRQRMPQRASPSGRILRI